MTRKKWVWLGLFLVAVLVSLHSPLFEWPLSRVLSRIAASHGYQVQIDDLDINLLTLSCQAKGLRVNGPGIDLALEQALIDADMKLLTGALSMDRVHLRHGQLELDPDQFEQKETSKSQSNLEFQLAELEIDQMTLRLQGSSSQLDFNLKNLKTRYRQFKLDMEGTFDSPLLLTVYEQLQTTPETATPWTLTAQTTNFIDYTDLKFQINRPGANITLIGSIQDLVPDFHFEANLKPRNEWLTEPVTIQANLRPLAQNQTIQAPRPLYFQGQARTDLSIADSQMPLTINLAANVDSLDLNGFLPLELSLDLEELVNLNGKMISDDWDFIAEIEANARSRPDWLGAMPHPLQDLEIKATLEGKLNFDHPVQSQLNALFTAKSPSFHASGTMQHGETTIADGEFQLTQGDSGDFQANYDLESNTGQVNFNSVGTDLGVWLGPDNSGLTDRYECDLRWQWPGALDQSTLFLNGTFRSEVHPTLGPRELDLSLQGVLTDLLLNLHMQESAVPVLQGKAQINGLDQQFTELDIHLAQFPVDMAPMHFGLDGRIRGAGTFSKPHLNGDVAFLGFMEDQLVLQGQSHIEMLDEHIHVRGLHLDIDQVQIDGLGEVGPEMEALFHMIARNRSPDIRREQPLSPLIGMEVPEFQLSLESLPGLMWTSWLLPSQNFEAGPGLDIPIAGSEQAMQIAGILLEDPQALIADRILEINTSFSLQDPSLFKTTAAPYLDPILPVELQMQHIAGDLAIQIDLDTFCPQYEFLIKEFTVSMEDQLLEIEPFSISFRDEWLISNMRTNLEGNTFDLIFESIPPDLSSIKMQAECRIPNGEALNPLIQTYVHPDVSLKSGTLTVNVHVTPEQPEIKLGIQSFAASAFGQAINGQAVHLNLGSQFTASVGSLHYNGRPVQVTQTRTGMTLQTHIFGESLPIPFPADSGDLDVQVEVTWAGEQPDFQVKMQPGEAPLNWSDPHLLVQDLDFSITMTWDDQRGYIGELTTARARINDGNLDLKGTFFPLDDIHLEVRAEQLGLRYGPNTLTSSANLKLDAIDDFYDLNGDITLHSGQIYPDFTLNDLTSFLAPLYPSVYFPDPFLDRINLSLEIANPKPLAFSHEYGFLELAIPSLKIYGTAAIPELHSGFIHIEPDSYLQFGTNLFLFKPSEVVFQPERPGDPYLQLYMEYGREDQPKDMQITGYVSDLESSPDATNITSFLASFLLGKYTMSLLSLEYRDDQELSDSSFSAVIQKQIGSKMYTRYVVPLDLKKETQRIEMGFGPFSDLFLSASQTVEELKFNARKTFHFGGKRGNGPIIKHLDLSLKGPEHGLERWRLRRKWSLRSDDRYSSGRFGQARKRYLDTLKAQGYLDAKIDSQWDPERARLLVDIQTGPQYNFEILDVKLPEIVESELIKHQLLPNGINTRMFKNDLNHALVSNGFMPGSPSCSIDGQTVRFHMKPGPPIMGYDLNLTGANSLLALPLKDSKWRRDTIIAMLLKPNEARQRIKGLLAAQGYLTPQIGRGRFNSDRTSMRIPIDPGPKAELTGIAFFEQTGSKLTVSFELLDLISNELVLPDLFIPFDHKLLVQTRTSIQNQIGDRYWIQVKPRQDEGNVTFQVTLRKKEKEVFHEILFSGMDRLPERSLFRLVRLPEVAHYPDLIEAQKRLLNAGTFQAVQLLTRDHSATFKVQERNRFDLGLGLSYSEEKGLSGSFQFLDRMFLNRPNDLAFRFETGHDEERALVKATFRNFFKSPGDFVLYTDRIEDKSPSIQEFPDFGIIRRESDYEIAHKVTGEYLWKLSLNQSLNFGAQYFWVDHITDIIEIDEFDDSILDSRSFTIKRTFLPLNLSWSFKNLDRRNNPRNGTLLAASLAYFLPSNTESDAVGTRWSLGTTWYRAYSRWSSVHRIKAGLYSPQGDGFFDLGTNNPTRFYLGGTTSFRGYRANAVGPLDPQNLDGLGGNAMFFASEDWVYNTYFYGIGIAGFLDLGQIWPTKDDIDFASLSYSGGIGLVYDSPVGYFRVDYAWQLNDKNPDSAENWSIKFGTLF